MEESPTAHTLFHKIKFDLYKAFGMIYDVMTSKKGTNTIWLGERYEVSQNTAWLFKRKIQSYLKSSKSNLLTGIVHVDEHIEIEADVVTDGWKSYTPLKTNL